MRSGSNKYIRYCFILALCLPAVLFGCGKKGDPTLKAYERPDTPSSVSAIHREKSIIVRWDYSKAKENLISEFIILRSTGAGFDILSHIEKDRRVFADSGIKIGSTYQYKIISRNFRGVSSADSAIITATPAEVPEPPVNLTYRVSGSTAAIRWDAMEKGVLFNIYKSAQKGVFGSTPVNSSPLSEPLFTDQFAVNKIAYYTVRSLRGGALRDEGTASAELMLDPGDLTPSAPEKLEAYAASDKVILSWREIDEPWVSGYRIYKRSGSGEFVFIGHSQVPTFTDHEAPTIKRDYRVTATGPLKEGPASETRGVIHIPQR